MASTHWAYRVEFEPVSPWFKHSLFTKEVKIGLGLPILQQCPLLTKYNDWYMCIPSYMHSLIMGKQFINAHNVKSTLCGTNVDSTLCAGPMVRVKSEKLLSFVQKNCQHIDD
jgi:hypothetical protein